MKKTLLYLTGVLLLLACGGGDEAGGDTPSGGNEYLNVSNINILGEETTAALSIQASDNCQWTITWSDSWIRSISPTTGRGRQEATITLDANQSASESRSAVIQVSNASGSIVRSVTLTQAASGAQVSISPSELNFSNTGGTQEVTVNSNTSWTVTGAADWMELSKSNGNGNSSIRITVGANISASSRSAVLVFTSSGNSTQLIVSQDVASLPTVQLPQITQVSKTEATITFSFNSELTVTTCGVYYSTEDNDNYNSHSYVSQEWSSSQGTPVIQLKGLSEGTTYYIHAYAVSAVGTSVSEKNTFTTNSSWPSENDVVTPY